MPLLPERFPGRNVLRTHRRLLGELREAPDGILEERPELGRVDFFQRVDANLDLLPRSAQRLHLDPRLVAINRQVGQLVECFKLDSLLQVIALERPAINAKLELEEPRLARDRVKKPAVGVSWGANLDHAALAPIGLG